MSERKFLKIRALMAPMNHMPVTNEKSLRRYFALARELKKHTTNIKRKYHVPKSWKFSNNTMNVIKVLNTEQNRLRRVAREMNTLKRLVPYEVYTLVGPKIYSFKKPRSPVTPNIRRLFQNRN